MGGHRGSSSSLASGYKKSGHQNEDDFGAVMGGTNIGLPAQGKTDWKSDSGTKFTIKKGFDLATRTWTKKWQIFLYGISRLKTDPGFRNIQPVGGLLAAMLDSFPTNFDTYNEDKQVVKAILNTLPVSLKGEGRLKKVFASTLESNQYVSSKKKLSQVTSALRFELENMASREHFFEKAFFNGNEVDSLVITEGETFVIYERRDVVSILTKNLSPSISSAGKRSDDLNIAGQKVVFKHDGKNYAELEVRNEPNHYRELRFNGNAKLIADLLRSKTFVTQEESKLQWRAKE